MRIYDSPNSSLWLLSLLLLIFSTVTLASKPTDIKFHDANFVKIDTDGRRILMKDLDDGTTFWWVLQGYKISDVPGATSMIESLAGGSPLSLLPGGKILTQRGVDVKRVLLESKTATLINHSSASDADRDPSDRISDENDYDTEEDDYIKQIIKHPEYHDPRTYSLTVMAFVLILAVIVLSGRRAAQPLGDPARIFQRYNRDHPITQRCATLMLWWVALGLALWVATALYAAFQLWFSQSNTTEQTS